MNNYLTTYNHEESTIFSINTKPVSSTYTYFNYQAILLNILLLFHLLLYSNTFYM